MGLRPRGREDLNLSAAHVAELCGEIEPLVRGARIREVLALPPRDAVLVLEREGATTGSSGVLRLRLSADPQAPRLHVQHERVERHEGPLGPFFRRLGSDLEGATVAGLSQVRGDRTAILEVRGSPAGERRAVLLELFGRRANLILLGPGDKILEVLAPPPASKEPGRLASGSVWRPPPGNPPAPSAPLAEAFATSEPSAAQAPLSRLVERALGGQAAEAHRSHEARDLAERIERKLERARGLLAGLEKKLAASAGAARVREDGELLKSSLPKLSRGMESVLVEDFFRPGEPPRRIELDPRLSPIENLERTFERARKLERSRDVVASEIELARTKERSLAELLESARDPATEPSDLEERAIEAGLLERKQESPARTRREAAPRLPYRAFEASRGSEIRVGRSARDNDELTFRHAKGSDLWLHTADAPGSHVVLVLSKGADPDSEELVDAAHLAAHFSPLRGAPRARIHVARRKEVHKPRGAKPGLVQLSGGKILDLRVQPERLRRLLGARQVPGSG